MKTVVQGSAGGIAGIGMVATYEHIHVGTGTRLAGRYRLVDQVGSGTGWTYWKATDETLARSVTVLTFATGFPG